MPPALRPRTRREYALLAMLVAAVLLWFASFVAVTADPDGFVWRWLILAAVLALFCAAIATLVAVVRRRRT